MKGLKHFSELQPQWPCSGASIYFRYHGKRILDNVGQLHYNTYIPKVLLKKPSLIPDAMKKFYPILFGSLLSYAAFAQDTQDPEPIITESTVTTKTDTTLNSPPASAISPTINTSNSDLCTFGVAGAVQTQILGVSTGTQITDDNCEMLKNAKTLYDMGMKVAAVSVMCQDQRVFDAMMNAGTPCPKDGLIGEEAKAAWEVADSEEPEDLAKELKELGTDEKTLAASGGILVLLAALLL